MADVCSKCQLAAVASCNGRGQIRVDDTTMRTCPNMYSRQIKQHMGPEIAAVQSVRQSPLLVFPKVAGPVVTDMTTQNLVIRTTWPGLLPHLKFVLVVKGLMFFTRIVTDAKIKGVFVGDEQYKSRPMHAREEAVVFNNVEDLLGADVDLAIIKLGYLGHKNKAAAGALKEALMLRETLRKPTWLVEDTRDGYEWAHSRSMEVEDFINRYEQMEIEPGDPSMWAATSEVDEKVSSPRKGHGIEVDEGDDEDLVQISAPRSKPVETPAPAVAKKPVRPRPPLPDPSEPEAPSMDGILDGFLSSDKPKFKKKQFGKKAGGW